MIKLVTYSANVLNYKAPVVRQATVYESEDPEFKGCLYQVSTHTGGTGAEWQFKPFKRLNEAQEYALQFLLPQMEVAVKIV
jgi:hypothetical protein